MKRNVTYIPSERVKSDIYRDALPLLNSRKCQLLDIRRLISQLHGLERRTARGGKDSIDHGPGAHDDVANAVAGAIVLAGTVVRKDPVARVGTFRVGMYDGIVEPDWFARGDRFPPGDPRAGMETNTIIHDHNAMKKANLDEHFS